MIDIKDVILFFLVVGVILLVAFLCAKQDAKEKHIVEPNTNTAIIDSVTSKNDSIKFIIINIDNEKDTKIKEVYNLSNDSTLKLFYELVKQ